MSTGKPEAKWDSMDIYLSIYVLLFLNLRKFWKDQSQKLSCTKELDQSNKGQSKFVWDIKVSKPVKYLTYLS